MVGEDGIRNTKSLIWGLFLVVVGGAFLLGRFGVIDLPNWGMLWPAVFFVIGVTHAAEGRFGSALMFILMGGWFFACTFNWMGLTYRNSWPLLMIAVGLGIVISALTNEDARRRRARGAS
jgi:hypothetical protein